MPTQKLIAAAAVSASLAAGAVVGVAIGNPLASGAQSKTTTTTAPAAAAPKAGTADADGPGRGRGPGGADLDVAAKALGITADQLRTELEAGKTIADVAKAKGVAKQKVIDALVAAGQKQLDAAKKALPQRVADFVDGKFPAGGPGDHGGPGGDHGGRPNLATAAKALGITEDALRTQLQSGKTIADVAKAQKVDLQKVIDALVADAKTHIATEVKDGELTQAEADARIKTLPDRITKLVNGQLKGPGPGGPGGPDGPGFGHGRGPGN